jgi:hypothetical protein
MRLAAVLVALMLGTTALRAQERAVVTHAYHGAGSAPARAGSAPIERFSISTSGPILQQRSGGSAFLIEALGGTAGAFVGGGLILLAREECDVEDTVCILESLGVAGIGSVLGATAGTYFAGKAADTQPSLVGAGLGAALGLAAGVGVVKLLDEANVRGKYIPIVSLIITEGTLTALGSRLLSRNR